MLLDPNESLQDRLAALGIEPQFVVSVPAVPPALRLSASWGERLLVRLTPEQQAELGNVFPSLHDGATAVRPPAPDRGGVGQRGMIPTVTVARHGPAFPCPSCGCRWLPVTGDPQRAVNDMGYVLRLSNDGSFRCCSVAWRWI